MDDKGLDNTKLPYDIERRSFDPEILNITLRALHKSVDDIKQDTSLKHKDLQSLILEIKKECQEKNLEIIRVDKEFSICRAAGDASRHSEEKVHQKRTGLLFNIITIILAAIALILSVSNSIRVIFKG